MIRDMSYDLLESFNMLFEDDQTKNPNSPVFESDDSMDNDDTPIPSPNEDDSESSKGGDVIQRAIRASFDTSSDIGKNNTKTLLNYVLMNIGKEFTTNVKVDGTTYTVTYKEGAGGDKYSSISGSDIEVDIKALMASHLDSNAFSINDGKFVNKELASNSLSAALSKAIDESTTKERPKTEENQDNTNNTTPSDSKTDNKNDTATDDGDDVTEQKDDAPEVDQDTVIGNLMASYRRNFGPRVDAMVETNQNISESDINSIAKDFTARLVSTSSTEVSDESAEVLMQYIQADIMKKIRVRSGNKKTNQQAEPQHEEDDGPDEWLDPKEAKEQQDDDNLDELDEDGKKKKDERYKPNDWEKWHDSAVRKQERERLTKDDVRPLERVKYAFDGFHRGSNPASKAVNGVAQMGRSLGHYTDRQNDSLKSIADTSLTW